MFNSSRIKMETAYYDLSVTGRSGAGIAITAKVEI